MKIDFILGGNLYSKEQQLKKVKEKKVSSFGKKRSSIKPRSKKNKVEKVQLSNDYYHYLHSSYQKCVVCGSSFIEIHHITDIKRIPDEPRRVWNRVITLCPEHHKNGIGGIHILSKDEFYNRVMSFEELMEKSFDLYQEYLRSNNA